MVVLDLRAGDRVSVVLVADRDWRCSYKVGTGSLDREGHHTWTCDDGLGEEEDGKVYFTSIPAKEFEQEMIRDLDSVINDFDMPFYPTRAHPCFATVKQMVLENNWEKFIEQKDDRQVRRDLVGYFEEGATYWERWLCRDVDFNVDFARDVKEYLRVVTNATNQEDECARKLLHENIVEKLGVRPDREVTQKERGVVDVFCLCPQVTEMFVAMAGRTKECTDKHGAEAVAQIAREVKDIGCGYLKKYALVQTRTAYPFVKMF